MDVERLRAWVNSQKGYWPVIAEECPYPYYSLQKFADGRIREPKLAKLLSLTAYMRRKKFA